MSLTLSVWHVDLLAEEKWRHMIWTAALPATERAVAAAATPAAQLRWTARAALRLLLARELDVAADTLRIDLDEHGKPILRGCPPPVEPMLHFNLSHSHETALIVLSRRGPVGIDVERHRPRARAEAIAARWLAHGSASALAEVEGEQRDAAFHRLWTIHEAFAKAVGGGLRMDLRSLQIEPGPPWPAPIRHPSYPAADWRYRELAISGYSAAVVSEGADWDVRMCTLAAGELPALAS